MNDQNIEQCFESLSDYLNQVLQRLNEGQFLTEQTCSEVLRLVDEVRQAQKHCVHTLHEAGVENPVCSSIKDFRTQIEECQRKTAMEQIAKVRQVMEEFLSVYSASGEYTAELSQRFDQIDLSNENTLMHIAESGELAQYQAFLDYVRAGTADRIAVKPLRVIFGSDLAFALMEGDLRLGEPSGSVKSEDSEDAVLNRSDVEPELEDQSEQDDIDVVDYEVTAVTSVWLTPSQPIREQKPTVEGFRKVMGKLPLEARAILPALSQFGALTLELTVRIGVAMRWDVTQPDESAYRTQVGKVLQSLENKGFVAEYETEVGPVFCLTSYGYGCLHRPKVRDLASQIFSIPVEKRGPSVRSIGVSVGQHEIIAKSRMESAVLCRTANEAEKTCEYLEWIRQNTEDAENICCSLRWRGNHYEVKVPCQEETVLCWICFEPETGENLLYLTDTAPTPCCATNKGIWFSGDSLLYWNADQMAWGDSCTTEALETNEQARKPAEHLAETESPVELESISEQEHMAETKPAARSIIEPERQDIPTCKPSCAQEYAQTILVQDTPVLSSQLLELTVRLLGEERFAEANALAETIARDPDAPKWAIGFYRTSRQALQVPGSTYQYNSSVINELWDALPDDEPELQILQQNMVYAILLWALAFPSDGYDHELFNNAKGNNGDDCVSRLIELLSGNLKEVSFRYDGLGLSKTALNNLTDNNKRERQLVALRSKAAELKATPTSSINITGLETCLKLLVGPTSPIGKAINSVAEDDRTQSADIQKVLENIYSAGSNDGELDGYIDQTWSELRRKDSNVKVPKLNPDTPARNRCKRALSDRLEVIQQWLSLIVAGQKTGFEQLRDQYARAVRSLKDALTELAARPLSEENIYERAGQAVMRCTAEHMLNRLDGSPSVETNSFSAALWLTPELILNEAGEHLVVEELYGVKGAEPWRLVLRAVAAGAEDSDEILSQIPDSKYSPRWNYNYGTEKWMLESRGETPPDRSLEYQKAKKAIEEEIGEFQSQVRLDWAEGKIQEDEKETAFAALDTVKEHYFNVGNFASLRQFISMLQDGLDRSTQALEKEYRNEVRQLESQYPNAPMLDVIRQALDRGSFNSAYSYINDLQNGITELPIIERPLERGSSFLREFLDCEEGYWRECENHKGSSPSAWGERILGKMPTVYRHWSSENERKKGCDWLSQWITGLRDVRTAEKVQKLLTGLGFQVDNVTRGKPARTQIQHEVYEVSAEPASSGRTDYPHPIYKFGTQLMDPFYVVCLFGCRGAQTLINLMTTELQLNGPTIVFMDGSLSVAERRRVAETFKANTSGQNSFLLIDRVLLLYLASLDEGNRLNAMLHCTLPYTFEVLYGNGVSTVPDEMFIGRVREVNDLRSEQGSDLVYGGRQLGKTALLRRVNNTLHHPETGAYSFFIEVKDDGSAVLLEKVCEKLERYGLLEGLVDDIASLCKSLGKLYEARKIHSLRIFVDETDQLFDEFSQDGYRSLRPFIELRNETAHHVKFVFAGTHNVAAMDNANDNNGNLVHMNSLCIEPLSISDAVKLIRIPMSYLGFEIGDREIDLILTNTNSYPGLIHMFCRALVQSVCSDYSTYYTNREKLPHRIEREQMQAVFSEKDIRREMGDKVMATIKLNQKYKIISNLLACCLYEARSTQAGRIFGYSARELLDYNEREFQIPLINEMSLQDMTTLLNEMCRMGILYQATQDKKRQEKCYRFRQREFLQFVGSEDEVLNTLLSQEDSL